jgi:23S rRNA pseudouridine1911/1915/1917 synthase
LHGNLQQKPHYKIRQGDQIFVCLPDKKPALLQPEDIPLEVLYEDNDVAVVNKQAGLVVHPAPGNTEHTLANALLYRFKELSSINPQRPGIVHRIDKETSGILVIAKNDFSHLALAGQFAKHTIIRKYVAVVNGKMEFDEGVIELPIGRHPRKRKNMAVGFGLHTKYAKTRYRTLRRSHSCSLLELELFTGRTHQIRVHLAFLGHPIMGDVKYGGNNQFSRMALHAKLLGFIHPRTHTYMEFSSEPPPEFLRLCAPNKS